MRSTRSADSPARGLVSLEEAARLLSVSKRTIRRQLDAYRASGGRAGIGPAYQFGARVTRVPLVALRNWVHSCARVGDVVPSAPPF